ncbi:MAG: sigma-70 family RNA polymerase sigma factor [Rhodospirillaceae bacterium]|nr:sigma-70 family RNA polymerase sigma factor [Rhodospirillaceae bacterium]
MTAEVADADLAVRAGAGDRRAFDQLVLRHKEPLFRLARSYVGVPADAYDVLQDTFISAWLAIGRYDSQRDFATWLRTLLLNKCRDYGRRQTVRRRLLQLFAREQKSAPPHQDAAVEHDDPQTRRLAALDAAIAELPSFYKEPLLLTVLSGLTQQEAAVQLGTTAKAIEMRIRRAKQKLAENHRLTDAEG